MKIGIGLPSALPGVERRTLLDWAQRAEELGFSTLGTIDRIVFPNYEPLITFAAAAAVTESIRLTSAVILGPLRANSALFAKQAASIDNLAPGRLTLGIGAGSREDDFTVSGVSLAGRGKRLDEQLDQMKRIWAGESFGTAGGVGPPPATPGGPELLFGGSVPATLRRVVTYGNGWVGAGPVGMYRDFAAQVSEAWQQAGREGQPRNVQLANFALGPNARENADAFLSNYYSFAPHIARAVVRGVAVNEEMVAETISAFAEAGCNELIFTPSSTDLEQVDLLADVALSS